VTSRSPVSPSQQQHASAGTPNHHRGQCSSSCCCSSINAVLQYASAGAPGCLDIQRQQQQQQR
jgi:hypothetical protein